MALSLTTLAGAVEELDGILSDFQQPYSGMPHWPPNSLISLMGIAQHYGLPTRLLDWTRSAYIAAYFAARPHAGVAEDDYATVWAFAPSRARVLMESFEFPKPRLVCQGAARATNPNLHAQDGLFTYIYWEHGWGQDDVDDVALEDLADRIMGMANEKEYLPMLIGFRFPRRLAPEVLWLLAKERVTAGRMFPDLRGVVDGLYEQLTIRKPPGQEDNCVVEDKADG